MPYRPPAQRAITPQGRGRFPGFDVLDQARCWDDVTAGVVLARLALPNMLSFFSAHEVGIAAPMLDLLLAQDDEPRVPVLALIDSRLATGETDGWHYDDMPEDGQAWRDTLAHLDDDARARHDAGYAELAVAEQARLLQDVQDLSHRGESWHGMSGHARLEPVDPLRLRRVLLTSVGMERDRVRRAGLPARLPEPRHRRRGRSWEVADHDDGDPVPFARRVERARKPTTTCPAADHGE